MRVQWKGRYGWHRGRLIQFISTPYGTRAIVCEDVETTIGLSPRFKELDIHFLSTEPLDRPNV